MEPAITARSTLGHHFRTAFVLFNCCALIPAFLGCAALTNPVADGICVRNVAPHHLAAPKDGKYDVPLTLLGQAPPENHLVDAGDILGVYVAGVIGEPDQLPPVNLTVQGVESVSLGYPVPVREDGTLTLPLIHPVPVNGMTIEQVEQQLIRAYTSGPAPVVRPDNARIIVTLVRARLTRVVVVRQDSPDPSAIPFRRTGIVQSTREFRGGAERLFRASRNGTGTTVYLPAYQNDVLNAIVQSGGLPGLDAANEIVIQRQANSFAVPSLDPMDAVNTESSTRIPLRLYEGEPIPFGPADVLLGDGDIIYIRARDTELFYTGGLLPSGEFPVPRDYDLTAVEAVAQIGGPLVNGGLNTNNLTGNLVAPGIGSPSPRMLTVVRQTPDCGRIRILVDLHAALRDSRDDLVILPGDMLILQETKHQALTRYATQIFNFSFFSNVISRADTTGTAALIVP